MKVLLYYVFILFLKCSLVLGIAPYILSLFPLFSLPSQLDPPILAPPHHPHINIYSIPLPYGGLSTLPQPLNLYLTSVVLWTVVCLSLT